MATQRFLEITYRNGKTLAAYFMLPRKADDRSVRTERYDPGLLVDYTTDGRAIGIEITAPSKLTLAAFNESLAAANQPPATPDDLAPLITPKPRAPA